MRTDNKTDYILDLRVLYTVMHHHHHALIRDVIVERETTVFADVCNL